MEQTPISHRSKRLISKQRKTDTTSSFRYGLLPDHSIRLLTVDRFGADGILQCTLTTNELVGSLQFYALSYTWGSGLANRTIHCDGKELLITENLNEALKALLPFIKQKGLPIWIDAVCINQHNQLEKEREVQRMDDIYRLADAVLIWLGLEAQDSSLAMQSIPSLTKLISAVEHLPLWTDLEKYGLPNYTHRVWPAIAHLYRRPWFSRLWTFQEAVLARKMLVFCGEENLDWEQILHFGSEMSRTRLKQLATSEEQVGMTVDDGFQAISHISTTKNYRKEMGDFLAHSEGNIDPESAKGIEYSAKAASMPFSSLLLYSQNKLTIDPRDRVYGTLSLAPRGFRKSIKVSYSKPLDQLSLEVGKACLEEEQSTSYLQFRAGAARSADLPSWCFDLSRPRGKITPFLNHLRAGFRESVDGPRATIHTIPDEAYIELVAFRADKIDQVVRPDFYEDKRKEDTVAEGQKRDQDWLRKCRQLSVTIGTERPEVDVGMAYVYTVTGNTISRAPDGEALKQSFEDFKRVIESQIKDPITKADWYWPPNESMGSFVDTDVQISRTCTGRAFFTTQKGRLGVGPPDVKTGDVVIVVYGAACYDLTDRTGSAALVGQVRR